VFRHPVLLLTLAVLCLLAAIAISVATANAKADIVKDYDVTNATSPPAMVIARTS